MINVLFCGNSYVFDGVLTGALSILNRTPKEEEFTFYVYTMDVSYLKPNYTPISDSMISFLDSVVKEYNTNNKVIKVDVTDYYVAEFKGCPNEGCYCSPYTLIRLFADMVPNMPSKLLYLDCDIMFNRDIRLLYNIDVSKYEYAAANDHYGKYLINPRYINAGVLLFNLDKMRETNLLKKARDILKVKHLPFADQSAIQRATTKKKVIAQKFNDQKFLHKHTVVRHFSKRLFWLPYPHTANIKQYNVFEMQRVFKYKAFDEDLKQYLFYKAKFEMENK